MRLFTVTSEITYDVFAETFKEAIELVHEAFVHDDSVYEWIDWDCAISKETLSTLSTLVGTTSLISGYFIPRTQRTLMVGGTMKLGVSLWL